MAQENSISVQDVEICLQSGKLFGFKFVGKAGLEAIESIKNMKQ